MHWATVFIFAFISAFMRFDNSGPDTATSVQLRYTGNMGVFVESENAAWWFDGLHQFYKPEFQHLPDSFFTQAFNKNPPFNKLKGLTFSHYHRDHYSALLTNRFLSAHQSIVISGSRQVGDSLYTERFINGWNKNGIIYNDESTRARLEAYNLAHSWLARHGQVENIMFSLLINGVRITHLGDADFDSPAYRLTAFLSADILIVPLWLVTADEGRKFLNKSSAKKIIITHIPPGTKVKCEGELDGDLVLFDQVGEKFDF